MAELTTLADAVAGLVNDGDSVALEAIGLDFLTTTGARTPLVITDLGVVEPRGGELTLTTLHPGGNVEEVRIATGGELRVAEELAVTTEPTAEELGALRELVARG